jgi:DNA-binding IclR family transcriptional regulator
MNAIPNSGGNRPIPLLSRGFKAIKILARAGKTGISFNELGRLLGNLPAPTLSRLLKALICDGYAIKFENGLYGPGTELQQLIKALVANKSLEEIVREALTAFANQTGESIAFARFYGDRLVITEKAEVADSFKMAQRGYTFAKLPDEGPVIVVAAFLSKSAQDRFLTSQSGQPEKSADKIQELAVVARQRGWHCASLPNRPQKGPMRICVPVLDSEESPVGELHCVIPSTRFKDDKDFLMTCLTTQALSISAQLAERNQ